MTSGQQIKAKNSRAEQPPAAALPPRRARGWLRTPAAFANIALIAAMIAILWGSIWLHLAQQRREVAADAVIHSGNLARAAAESIGQTISGVDDALRLLRSIYSADPAHFDIGIWASRINREHQIALEFVLMNRDGMLTASSLGPINTPIDFSRQSFFKAQLDSTEDGLFISDPILGRSSGRWSVLFTRKITAADGWLTGVIAASADASWLTRLHEALDIGSGSLILVGNDGIIRAQTEGGGSGFGAGVGQNIAGSPLLAAARKVEQGSLTWADPADGREQIISFRHLGAYPLLVAVGLDAREVFTPYRLHVRQYEIFGACLTALIVLTGCLLLANTRRLLVSRQVLRDSVDAISQGIVMVDRHGRVPVINRRAADLLRLPARLVAGSRMQRLARLKRAGGEADELVWPAGVPLDGLSVHTRGDGRILEVQTHTLTDGRVVRTYADITERRRAEEEITRLANHDGLTGLANRRLFTDRLATAVLRVERKGGACAVLCIDIDGFRRINDLYGHGFGDAVLRQAAQRISSLAVGSVFAARLSGDEFCLMQTEGEQPSAAVALGARIRQLLRQPYTVEGQDVQISASVGIALCPAHGCSVDELLTNADTALHHAKQAGEDSCRLYETAMGARATERRQLEEDLRNALTGNQLQLLYQPIFSARSGALNGFEALLRWEHPSVGTISPEAFVPVAEESGQIVALGQWVIETACRDAQHWPERLHLAVNLSPRQFLQTDLAERIMNVLGMTDFAATRLTLEVTEGVLIDNSARALMTLAALRHHGVCVSLDDFGTGYSNLSYLRQLPLDSLKIDKSFVQSLSDDAQSHAIVEAILALGKSLALSVVAEGVETPAQLQWLRAAGCSEVQGFLLGRPMSTEAAREFAQRALAVAPVSGGGA
jgi:diguanylate cyclase (GGDEF)-like protein